MMAVGPVCATFASKGKTQHYSEPGVFGHYIHDLVLESIDANAQLSCKGESAGKVITVAKLVVLCFHHWA